MKIIDFSIDISLFISTFINEVIKMVNNDESLSLIMYKVEDFHDKCSSLKKKIKSSLKDGKSISYDGDEHDIIFNNLSSIANDISFELGRYAASKDKESKEKFINLLTKLNNHYGKVSL